ncbi:hypothetical protein CCP1ISM_360009 [Azospirillaceae bacterium]
MRELGILLVVWGMGLPLVSFPLFRNYFPDSGLLASLPQMCVFVGEIEISYTGILQFGVLMIGIGLSLWIINNKCRSCPSKIQAKRN